MPQLIRDPADGFSRFERQGCPGVPGAASYQMIDGTIVDPIQRTGDAGAGVHPYSGTNLAPGANLTGANLTGADLPDANLTDANLIGVNLHTAKLFGVNLTNAYLSDANLYGAQSWQSAHWHGATYNDATIFPEGMNPEKFGMIYDDTADVTEGACCVTSGCDVVEETMCTNFGGT